MNAGARRQLKPRRPAKSAPIPAARHRGRRAAPAAKTVPAFPWRRLALVLPLVALGAALLYRQIDPEAIHARAAEFNGAAAFGLLAILPLLGFPASVLHVAAGIRFGSGLGLGLVSASILFQLLVSYGVAHFFRARLSRWSWVKRVRQRIPQGAHTSICVFAVLLPGAPYAAINYTLPIIGVPLSTYLLCCLPLHTLRATVTVLLGGQSNHLTGARLAVLGAYAVLILGASWWTFRRLRTQLADPPAAEDGQRQPA
jgi:uncharacterized membrane protein YdjX (TVP38/TMEM64 family)